jgi:broad specificity phosphatase PhoE
MKFKSFVLCAFVLFLLFSAFRFESSPDKVEPTTLIIVRHAEKNNETDTTTLTPQGYDRANRLAQWLQNIDLAAIYATPYVRMKLTAAPVSVQKNLPVREYLPKEISEIERIISAHRGQKVLVVGHGNFIHEIVNHYCGSALGQLTGYNDIFVLRILNPEKATNACFRFYY